MSNISIKIDTKTQDYVPLNGQIANSNQLECQIYQLLLTPRTRWLYAPTDQYGSDLYTILNQRQRVTKTQILEIVTRALQPITSTGEFTITNLSVPILTLGTINIKIEGVDSSGNQIHFDVDALV